MTSNSHLMKALIRNLLATVLILLVGLLLTGCGKPKPSKLEWKSQLAEKHQIFGLAGIIQMPKADFVQLMGEPDKTQLIGGRAYWYYTCKDGTVQLDLDAGNLMVGVVAGRANDY